MRARVWFLGLAFSLALTMPASAQFVTSMGSKTTGASSGSSIPGFFSSPLAKPSSAPMSVRPSVPAPLNLSRMMPTFPNLRNTIMLRNFFGSPQTVVQMPQQQVPPPPKN